MRGFCLISCQPLCQGVNLCGNTRKCIHVLSAIIRFLSKRLGCKDRKRKRGKNSSTFLISPPLIQVKITSYTDVIIRQLLFLGGIGGISISKNKANDLYLYAVLFFPSSQALRCFGVDNVVY